jgi:hypothetical protein
MSLVDAPVITPDAKLCVKSRAMLWMNDRF